MYGYVGGDPVRYEDPSGLRRKGGRTTPAETLMLRRQQERAEKLRLEKYLKQQKAIQELKRNSNSDLHNALDRFPDRPKDIICSLAPAPCIEKIPDPNENQCPRP